VRDLQKADNPSQPPPLSLAFALDHQGHLAGSTADRTFEVPEVTDVDSRLKSSEKVRNQVDALIREASSGQVILAIKNSGSSGIRNLFVEMSISTSTQGVAVSELRVDWWKRRLEMASADILYDTFGEGVTKTDDGWRFSFEWVALQPQRTRLVRPELLVQSGKDATIEFTAKVFADSFPAPLLLMLV
jgi:hypothetical protein